MQVSLARGSFDWPIPAMPAILCLHDSRLELPLPHDNIALVGLLARRDHGAYAGAARAV